MPTGYFTCVFFRFELISNRKITTSSAALDLAHRSQTSPRNSFSGRGDKHSEWPQFSSNPRAPHGLRAHDDRRTVTNPTLTLTSSPVDLSSVRGGGTSTPHAGQHPQASLGTGQAPVSRRGSPAMSNTRSVPATPLSMTNGGNGHLLQNPGTPDSQALSGRLSSQGSYALVEDSGKSEIQPSLSRMSSGQYDGSMGYGQYDDDNVYGLSGQMDNGRFSSYDLDSSARSSQGGSASGSTALYHHNGTRYGLHLGRGNSADGKMNGLHGPKHKRGDMDCKKICFLRLWLCSLIMHLSEPFCRYSAGGPSRRNTHALQRPAWLPLPPEKA